MAGMSSLGVAVSGLNAAQSGLYVTGHNMSNVDTPGYSRQRVLQRDFIYNTVGYNANGPMKVGLGTDVGGIRQIRDRFLDITYRKEVSRLNFYSAKGTTGAELEGILGELMGEYNTQSVVQNLWDSLHELSMYPEGYETRNNFVSTALIFIDKINSASDQILKYQYNLNEQIKDSVKQINSLVSEIESMNRLIASAEASGDAANDYRDQRNLALDQLSGLLDITYSEDKKGNISIMSEGKELLSNGYQTYMGLRYTSGDYSFVEPILTNKEGSKTILSCDEDYRAFFKFNPNKPISAENNNDKGLLKGLMVSRGFYPANYTSTDSTASADEQYNATTFMIPKLQNQLDTLVNKIVELINNAFSAEYTDENGDKQFPYNANGEQVSTPIFVPINDGVPPPMSMGNIQVNPLLLDDSGLNLIATSRSGDLEDNNLLLELLDRWDSPIVSLSTSKNSLNIDDAYREVIGVLASETHEAIGFTSSQEILVEQADSKRLQIMGVSLDEEMTNMMKYQYAYNSAAKVLNVIDSMLDRIINYTGR